MAGRLTAICAPQSPRIKAGVDGKIDHHPNAQVEYRPDAAYIRALVASIPLTQREIARRVGVSDRYIRALVAGTRTCNYPVQYCLECLSRGLNDAAFS